MFIFQILGFYTSLHNKTCKKSVMAQTCESSTSAIPKDQLLKNSVGKKSVINNESYETQILFQNKSL